VAGAWGASYRETGHLEQQREQALARLSLTDEVFLRSYNWARWQLGIPVPLEL
jgi:hypothetical protein